MRRPAIALLGVFVGAALAVLLGACGSEFECKTTHYPLMSGTYTITGRTDFSLVFDLNGRAIEDYVDSDTVHAEYSVGPATAVTF